MSHWTFEDPLEELDFQNFRLALQDKFEKTGQLTRGERREINRQIEDLIDAYIDTHGEPRAWQTVCLV